MRKTISVAALLLALTCSAYAGEIQNDSPKPSSNAAQEPTDENANGDIQNGMTDAVIQTAIDLFAVLPSLL